MRVLITGGSGFLGQSLLSYLLDNTKYEIFTLSRSEFDYKNHHIVDLLELGRLREVIDKIQPDIVFHAAGNASNKPDAENPSGVLQSNIIGTNNLLSCLKNNPIFINISSVVVYGKFSLKNPAYYLTATNPLSLYAVSKLASEDLVNVYTDQKKVQGISIRLPALVGRAATHGLLKDLVLKLLGPEPTLNLIGNAPGSIKPFCNVDDVADLICKIGIHFNAADYNKFVIISNEDSLSVEEVAHLVMDELNIRKDIVWSGQSWVGDNPQIYISSDLYPKNNSTETVLKYIREIIQCQKE